VSAKGNLEIEITIGRRIAITLGQALIKALGDKSGITRYGEAVVPMEEAPLPFCKRSVGPLLSGL